MNILKKRKIKIFLKEPKNNECFECPNKYPEYISLNNGIFLCQECAKLHHFNLPRNISYIIKNNLNDISLKDIQYLSYGGNRKLLKFINDEFPNLKNFNPVHFYQTKAMDYYRKYLEYLIEGGIKPIKPEPNKGYELMSNEFLENYNISNNKNKNNNLFEGNLIQFNKNEIREANYSNANLDNYNNSNSKSIYPKIKPRIGLKNDFRLTKSLNRFFGKKVLTPNISYYSNIKNISNDEFTSYRKYISTSSDFKSNYSQFRNNYDIDGDESYNEIKEFKENEINDKANNISEINDDLVKTKEINFNSLNNINTNSTLKRKQNTKNEENYSSIKVFKISKSISNNNNNNNNNDKIKSKYQNNLKNLENDNNALRYTPKHNKLNLNKNKSSINLKNKEKKLINNINELNMYLKYGKNQKNGNDINKPKKQFNNINNNIIINRNLNVFYNNNDYNSKKVFKKKPIGNSFSINEKKYKSNNSFEKSPSIKIMKRKKICNLKKKLKNDFMNKVNNKNEQKFIGNNMNTFIKVNKINNKKDKKAINISSDINNISFGNVDSISSNNIFINNKLKEHKNNYNNSFINNDESIINQKSELIQKISEILKDQREKREKKKSFEKIKVNQKNNYLDIKKKLIYYKLNNVELNIKAQQKKEKEKEKVKLKEKLKGKEKEKEKGKEKIKSRSYTEIKTENSENIFEYGKRSLLQFKDLINLPFGKKRNILEIVKKNNLSSKSASPNLKRLFRISSEPKFTKKNI